MATRRMHIGCGGLLSVCADQAGGRRPAAVRFGPPARANSKAKRRCSTTAFCPHFPVLSCETTHTIFTLAHPPTTFTRGEDYGV